MYHFKHFQTHPSIRNRSLTGLSSYTARAVNVHKSTAKLDLHVVRSCLVLSLTSASSAAVTSPRTSKAYKANDKVATTLSGNDENLGNCLQA